MSATHTSSSTDSKKLMPTLRACTTASHASHKASTPATRRTPAGMRGQPGTPALSSQAAARTHSPPPTTQRAVNGRSTQPNAHDPAHKATQATPTATEPAWPKPLRRPHSQAPAAIRTSTTSMNGTVLV